MLKVSDQFMADDVKIQCEAKLATLINISNFSDISEAAETYNASKLKSYVLWFSKSYSKEINK